MKELKGKGKSMYMARFKEFENKKKRRKKGEERKYEKHRIRDNGCIHRRRPNMEGERDTGGTTRESDGKNGEYGIHENVGGW